MECNGKKFSENGYIENNIKNLVNEDIKDGTDQVVILVVGGSNTGKTSLSLLIQNYILGEVRNDWIALNHDEFIELYTTNHKGTYEPPKKCIVYEEGRESFYRTNNTTNKNKEAKNTLFEYRSFQNFVIINFQDIRDFTPKPILNNLIDLCIRTTKPGTAHIYSQNNLKSMFSNDRFKKFLGWNDPEVTDYFEDPEQLIPEKWAEYEKQNIKKLNQLDDEEQDPEPTGEESGLKVTPKNIQALKYVKKNPGCGNSQLVEQNIYNSVQASNQSLNKLVGKGFVTKTKGEKNRYKITEKGETLLELV